MGDNIFLGDRDGVRTPCSGHRSHAGFSKGPIRSAFYLPPIMDAVMAMKR